MVSSALDQPVWMRCCLLERVHYERRPSPTLVRMMCCLLKGPQSEQPPSPKPGWMMCCLLKGPQSEQPPSPKPGWMMCCLVKNLQPEQRPQAAQVYRNHSKVSLVRCVLSEEDRMAAYPSSSEA